MPISTNLRGDKTLLSLRTSAAIKLFSQYVLLTAPIGKPYRMGPSGYLNRKVPATAVFKQSLWMHELEREVRHRTGTGVRMRAAR